MELDNVLLRSDVERADPWQIAQEVQAASALVRDTSRALGRLFDHYQALSLSVDGYTPMSRDCTRSARFEVMRNLRNARYLRDVADVRISDLHHELQTVMQARRNFADPLLLEDVQELLHSHLNRVQDFESLLEPLAARHIRDKIVRLLTNVGVPFVQAAELDEGS